MKTRPNMILFLMLVFVLAAYGTSPQTSAAQEQPAPAKAALEDGVQVIHVTIGPRGYEPGALELQQGIPARLVFTRTTDNTCAKEIQSPDLGIDKTPIPLNELVEISLTPESDGTFTFACGLDMMKGTIIVKS